MKHSFYRKRIVLGLIILFVGVGLSPVVKAFDNNLETVYVPIENSDDHKVSDDYEEIITLIIAHGDITSIKLSGLFLREVSIMTHVWCEPGINLYGLRRSNGRVEIYQVTNLRGTVHIPRFRAFTYGIIFDSTITGIAFGNIDY